MVLCEYDALNHVLRRDDLGRVCGKVARDCRSVSKSEYGQPAVDKSPVARKPLKKTGRCRRQIRQTMKTAYELAMERLAKSAPTVKLTDEQKKKLAELDSFYTARIAERELGLQAEITQAEARGDFESAEKYTTQLAAERRNLQAELQEKKEKIRQG